MRDASFSSGISKYRDAWNPGACCGACDHAAAATMPIATMTAGTISLFIDFSLGLLRD
jgi:hypothetical protein